MDAQAELNLTIAQAFADAGHSGIIVSVDDTGVCTLQGMVSGPDEEAYLCELAQQFGVADVISQLEAMPEDQGPPMPEVPEASSPEAQSYLVVKGDSYWGIAKRFYGDGRLYPKIKEANPDFGRLHPGKTLIIPPLPDDVA